MSKRKMTSGEILAGFILILIVALIINILIYGCFALFEGQLRPMLWSEVDMQAFKIVAGLIDVFLIGYFIKCCCL